MTQAAALHSTPPTNTSGDTAGALYRRTDISSEELFHALGRPRQEAMDEIERLLTFLDSTEPDPDLEPSLGSGLSGGDDREAEDENDEPSLGADGRDNQLFSWMGDITDREADPAESGIADHDGLLEQIGTQDWQQGGMALINSYPPPKHPPRRPRRRLTSRRAREKGEARINISAKGSIRAAYRSSIRPEKRTGFSDSSLSTERRQPITTVASPLKTWRKARFPTANFSIFSAIRAPPLNR